MFSLKFRHPNMLWERHAIGDQPQGQGGLSKTKFKDNVSRLDIGASWSHHLNGTGVSTLTVSDPVILKLIIS